ncbi:MAG: hypothetical protein HQL69_02105 [Magnetococcales bacterium]|nr:hypothetical protein [Magnetococcales bacterium]
MLQTYKNRDSSDNGQFGIFTCPVFVAYGLVFLDDFEQTLLSLQHHDADEDVWKWLSESMVVFHKRSVQLDLKDVSCLAYEVAQIFCKRYENNRDMRGLNLNLINAALSQMRFLLDPDACNREENSLRILTGLMKDF